MEFALQKTISLLIFILIGFLLKLKFKNPEEITGLKKIILNLALPATIFIALLKIEISTGLMLLPFFAILLNVVLYAITGWMLPLIGISKNSAIGRTSRLLIPSLAPGLSCFPFVLEFLGDSYLAKAAMADLGNKIFVLVVLYIIAMKWFYKNNHREMGRVNNSKKIKDLLLTMLKEPVNIFIFGALVFVLSGVHLNMLPVFLKDTFTRLSLIMTPLVLLFIGLAFKIKRLQFVQIFSMLMLRAGIVLILVSLFAHIVGIGQNGDVLLMVSFSLSACSFWPFAHISLVGSAEKSKHASTKTFDSNFAIGVLALSLPISTILILGILSAGNMFAHAFNLLILGVLCCFSGIFAVLCKNIKLIKQVSSSKEYSESNA
ncbi:permease [Galbibacter sp. PAP.153]|uniref:AEC family transporter n=1 Tax=Galbibacter sp. PAP.153 TaxID=3104623 RepID=UPI0030087777